MDIGNKKSSQILVCCIVFLISSQIKGQIFSYDSESPIQQIDRYNKDILEILSKNLQDDYIIRLIAKPTFDPEYVFQIRKVNDTDFEIETVIFQENLWYKSDRKSLPLQTYNRPIKKELAQRLDVLFTSLIFSYDGEILATTEDGIQFDFLKKSIDGIKWSRIYSPDEDSLLGRVIVLCDDLIKYSKDHLMILDYEQTLSTINELIHLSD